MNYVLFFYNGLSNLVLENKNSRKKITVLLVILINIHKTRQYSNEQNLSLADA